MTHPIDIAGERISLLAHRALYWIGRGTLILTDTHFGKDETFRGAGIAVPGNAAARMLRRLDEAIMFAQPSRLLFLGDFWHAPAGRSTELVEAISVWRRRHRSLEIDLVLGNHDRRVARPPTEWDMRVHAEPFAEGPFVFAHYPDANENGYVLAGHLHPGRRLHGRGKQRLRLPCFHFGERVGVLPAFGEFTGLADMEMRAGDRCFVVGEEPGREPFVMSV